MSRPERPRVARSVVVLRSEEGRAPPRGPRDPACGAQSTVAEYKTGRSSEPAFMNRIQEASSLSPTSRRIPGRLRAGSRAAGDRPDCSLSSILA